MSANGVVIGSLARSRRASVLRLIEPEVAMNGGDEDPAVFKVGPHDDGKRDLSGGVERGRRLVKQPKRALGDEQASKRDASSLARGKQPQPGIDHVAKPSAESAPSCAAREELPPSIAGAKARFRRRSACLYAVHMAERTRCSPIHEFAIATVQRKAAGFNGRELASALSKLAFPAPLGPVTISAAPRSRFERSSATTSAPAFDRQVAGSEPHRLSGRARFWRGKRLVRARRPSFSPARNRPQETPARYSPRWSGW